MECVGHFSKYSVHMSSLNLYEISVSQILFLSPYDKYKNRGT